MREIKFRVWDINNKEWIANGDIMDLYYSAKCNAFMFDNDSYDLPKSLIFVQYTGLKDKNGKEIYEGDIIKGQTVYPGKDFEEVYENVVGFIEWFEEFFAWCVNDEMLCAFRELEVMGNIYENPELLNKQ